MTSETTSWWRRAACIAWLCALAGCGDETTDPTPADPTGSGGGGGAGASGGSGGDGGTSTTGGGGPGGGGSGGGGSCEPPAPAALPCVDATVFEGVFTISDPSLCVVAAYTTDAKVGFDDTTFFTAIPTWGRHQGPLLVFPSQTEGSVDLVRLTAPDGASGAMTKQATSAAAAIPAGAYLGAQAFDPAFAAWTAVSYTTGGGLAEGEVILLDGTDVGERHAVNGIYAGAILDQSCDEGRLLYTGLGALGDAAGAVGGLYAADSCGADATAGLSDGTGSCPAPVMVGSWASFSGPVAVDSAGNVVALLTESDMGDSTNLARGFEASAVVHGAGPASGDELFQLPGFGASLAALAPSGDDPGLVLFQPNDSATFSALDVVAQPYDVSGGHVTAMGAPTTFLQLTTPGSALWMFTDPHDRLWVAAPQGASTTFFVLARDAMP